MAVSCAQLSHGSSPETAILGHVRRSGDPAARAYVRVNHLDGEFLTEAWCGPTGTFHLSVPPGEWDVVCLAPGSRLQQRLYLERGDQYEVDFSLEAA
jgi:hypothetical protein